MLKKRQWLTINEKMADMSPKEYYEEIFKEIIQKIIENENRAKKYISIKK